MSWRREVAHGIVSTGGAYGIKLSWSFRGRRSLPLGDGSEAGPPSHMPPVERGSPEATGRAGTPRPGGRGGAEARCGGSGCPIQVLGGVQELVREGDGDSAVDDEASPPEGARVLAVLDGGKIKPRTNSRGAVPALSTPPGRSVTRGLDATVGVAATGTGPAGTGPLARTEAPGTVAPGFAR